MYKRDRKAFAEKIAREPMRALHTLNLLMAQTGQDVKRDIVLAEIERRENRPTLLDEIENSKDGG